MKIPWSYLFMSLTAIGIVLFFVLGGPQALRVALLNKESVIVPPDPNDPSSIGRALEIVTLLPRDGIQAVLNPRFITPAEATRYASDEPVLGVSINGESRAYSVPFLSGREVVNDTVGGVPIAVTW